MGFKTTIAPRILSHSREVWLSIAAIAVMLIGGTDCRAQFPSVASVDQAAHHAARRQQLRFIIISTDAIGKAADSLENTIEAQLSDLNVSTAYRFDGAFSRNAGSLDQIARAAITEQNAHAAFMISPNDRRNLHIVISVDEQFQTVTRKVDVSDGVPWDEAIAVIVRSTALTLLEMMTQRDTADETGSSGLNAGSSDIPSVRVSITSGGVSVKEDGRRSVFFVHSGLALDFYADKKGPRPGLSIGMGLLFKSALVVQLSGTLFSTVSASEQQTDLTLLRQPVYLSLGYLKMLDRFYLGGNIALGMDIVRARTVTDNEDLSTDIPDVQRYGTVSALFSSGYWVSRFMCLHIDAGVRIPLDRKDYGIVTAEGNVVLVAPRHVQPSIIIGMAIYFY